LLFQASLKPKLMQDPGNGARVWDLLHAAFLEHAGDQTVAEAGSPSADHKNEMVMNGGPEEEKTEEVMDEGAADRH
jgi:hypothetical protein